MLLLRKLYLLHRLDVAHAVSFISSSLSPLPGQTPEDKLQDVQPKSDWHTCMQQQQHLLAVFDQILENFVSYDFSQIIRIYVCMN